MTKQPQKDDKPALPQQWITPIRLLVYLILAACSAYIFFNVKQMAFTHYLIFVSIAAVCAMVLLDCKMSQRYWNAHSDKESKD